MQDASIHQSRVCLEYDLCGNSDDVEDRHVITEYQLEFESGHARDDDAT